jgi:outer membrane receptor for monomeric catechols
LTSAALAQHSNATLPQVTVSREAEWADGPVTGYRSTRSATFTRTATPLEVPASATVLPAELMKDQAMQSLAEVIRYVPGRSGVFLAKWLPFNADPSTFFGAILTASAALSRPGSSAPKAPGPGLQGNVTRAWQVFGGSESRSSGSSRWAPGLYCISYSL